ncbi:hypothetical protein BCR44DRAFT_35423 [Catenaria anguillulae PL171]|uniref:Ankyrin repeat-containing domain protein n=1 Tax=Catenaria anguillulae PL171 TaxID=765915 RepID=A0A1Y2HRM3_9FUNG|nr:hypothetical protein BCR44DRAFT_35423 [Catenaria anguillulae PL171]
MTDMPTSATPIPGTTPLLTLNLVELVLAVAIQQAAIASRWNPTAVAQPLNALDRSTSPLLTKVALIQLPHIDMDFATKVGDIDLLRFMLVWSNQPGGRPIYYHRPIFEAMRAGHLRTLDWWIDESGLFLQWDENAIEQACGKGWLHVLAWWQARGFPRIPESNPPTSASFATRMVASAICAASRNGHVWILDWLWEHLPHAQFYFGEAGRGLVVTKDAAENGQIAVLDWWMCKVRLGVIKALSLTPIVTAAFKERQVQVLEWCQQNPEAVTQHHAPGTWWRHRYRSALAFAIQGSLLDWIDTLCIMPHKDEYWPASRVACELGSVGALEWLHDKGFLAGSRLHLVSIATAASAVDASGVVRVLEWIHDHVNASAPSVLHVVPRSPSFSRFDPYFGACVNGHLEVLNWLHLNGYQLDEADLVSYFELGCSGHTVVLDWLVSTTGVATSTLAEMAFAKCLRYATYKASIPVLDWWRQILASPGVLDLPNVQNRIVKLEGISLSATTLSWWLYDSGPLRHRTEMESVCPESCKASHPCRNSQGGCIDVLQVWLDAGKPINFADCIKVASASGNLAALDWLLHVAKSPVNEFVEAFICQEYIGIEDCAKTMLWWRANVPQVVNNPNVVYNGGPYSNPIHVHLLAHVLKLSTFTHHDPGVLSEHGNVAMLRYYQRNPDKYRLLMQKDMESSESLTRPSLYNQVHVLEWWKSESGFEIVECPEEVSENMWNLGDEVEAWWSQTGLWKE